MIEKRGQMIMVDDEFYKALLLLKSKYHRAIVRIFFGVMLLYTCVALIDFFISTMECMPVTSLTNHYELNPISYWFMSHGMVPLNLLIPLYIYYILAIVFMSRATFAHDKNDVYFFTFFMCYAGLFIFAHLMGFIPYITGVI